MKNKKIDYNAKAKHSFYVCAKNAGLLRNGRPKRASQRFKNLKKEKNKKECRLINKEIDL